MNKTTATEFLDALAWFESPFGKMDLLLNELEGTEREDYKEVLGKIALGHFDLIMPIIKQYPELDPDGEGKQMYLAMKEKYGRKET